MNLTEKRFSVCREGSRGNPKLFARRAVILCVVAAGLLTFSCKKRDPVSAGAAGELKFQPAKFTDAIPEDYGPLIGVTQNPADPAWVGLWFQKADKTITTVFVDVNQGRMYEKTLTIPRK